MFLSIITINRNNAEGLKKTLDSVAAQTCRDFEHIIIDGASTDTSVEVIKDYIESPAGKNVSYWVSEPDSGVYNAMNKGIKKASGDYCLFLNSGDWLIDKNVIKKEQQGSHTEDIIYFDYLTIRKNKTEIVKLPDILFDSTFLLGPLINHQNEFIKTMLLKENPYNEKLKILADNEFNVKMIKRNNVSYKHYSYPISCYEAYNGISSKQKVLAFKEYKQVCIEYFGEDCYEKYALLRDYETGYWGILKKMRLLLNFIAKKTTRR